MSAHWSEKQPIIKAGVNPLPFVQQGMLIRVATQPQSAGCVVLEIYEDENGMTVARLQGVDTGRSLVMSCAEIRRCFVLLTDFDPNLPEDVA